MERYRWAQGNHRRAGAEGKSKTELLLQYAVAPVLTAVLGFLVGFGIEETKATSRAEELLRAQRTKVWIAASEHSAAYINNWSRLRSIAEYGQKKKGGLTPIERARLNEYVSGRGAALDALSGDLDQARLFFSADVGRAIDDFEAFVFKYRITVLKDLPPVSDYAARKNEILKRMRKEVLP